MKGAPQSPYRDVLGRKAPERLSEYFDFDRFPDKAERRVTRIELMAILESIHKHEKRNRWYTRLWRWLKSPRSKPVVPPTPESEG